MLVRITLILSLTFIATNKLAFGISVDALARCIMSEASIGTQEEKIAIGFACQRNRNHAGNQSPSAAVTQLARNILAGRIRDPTGGANHWYSPRSMPKETQKSLCRSPIGRGNMDCRGGLESVCSSGRNYKPSWAAGRTHISIAGVRDCFFKFYRL